MGFGKALLWGLGGGLVGSIVWALVSYFVHFEIGWIAWGIGALCGASVRAASSRDDGMSVGVGAGVAAALCILLGKIGAVAPLVSQMGALDPVEHEEYLISILADDVVFAKERAGEAIAWPGGAEPYEPEYQSDYPGDVWQAARRRWTGMMSTERSDFAREPWMFAETELVVSYIADGVVDEYVSAGRALQYQPGAERDGGWRREDYPEDVWTDALARWDGLGEDGQMAYRVSLGPELRYDSSMSWLAIPMILWWQKSVWDLLWFGLGVATAVRLAMS